jgi:uncharacterized protein with GYD domain
MERYVTLIEVTPKGRKRYRDSGDCSTQLERIVESFGGTSEGIWALGEGPCQFVVVATYPDGNSAQRARTEIEALGLVTIEGYPISEMAECLQVVWA